MTAEVIGSCNNSWSGCINCLGFSNHRSDLINFELQIRSVSPSLIWSYQFLRSFRSPIWLYHCPFYIFIYT